MSDIFEEAYDPQKFKEKGYQLIDMLSDHLSKAQSGGYDQVLPWKEPDEMLEVFEIQRSKENDSLAFYETVLEHSIRLHHPQYLGHQVSPTLPTSALSSLFSSLLNNGNGIYEMGPFSASMEVKLCKQLAEKFDMGPKAGGFLTSGGTLANLTALLTARAVKAPNVWSQGVDKTYAVMVSEMAHYCVDRAVKIMGLGEKGIIKIPVDENYRMRTDLLEDYLKEAEEKGIEVIALVGSAPCTATGSYDPLWEAGKFCEKHEIWYHIDAAHGGASIFSEKYKGQLKGSALADSLIMDFHKMALVPALTTAVLYKKEAHAQATFSTQASYLWDKDHTEEWYNTAKVTFECTKLMMSIKVLAVIDAHGFELWEAYVDRTHQQALDFYELIQKEEDWEVAMKPDSNIICYRWIGHEQEAERNRVNEELRKILLKEGKFYIVRTLLGEKVFLRSTLMNPLSDQKHFQALLKYLKELLVQVI